MFGNILTVDLEDWFVVENLRENIDYAEWGQLPARVTDNTRHLLKLFNHHGVRATFFILGWIAEKHPDLISEVASYGHEIACHSYAHIRVDTTDEETFRIDTSKAMDAIIKATGIVPIGYRAPSWSINTSIMWAYEVLADLGFKYDSSVYPIKHDIYGEPDAPRDIFKMVLRSGRKIFELPASTVRFMGKNMPVGGGGYLRHSPYWYTARIIRRLNNESRPVVVYIHPWELDENQPRTEGLSIFQRFRQYGSIATLKKKIEKLLAEFDFIPAGDYVNLFAKKRIGFE